MTKNNVMESVNKLRGKGKGRRGIFYFFFHSATTIYYKSMAG